MAIQTNYSFRGAVLSDAYLRIVEMNFSRTSECVTVSCAVLANSEMQEAFTTKSFVFAFTATTGDPIKWAYNQLKLLPEFAGAVDV